MLTKLTIRNFKLFEDVEIELGNPVVFIGPNNSGKTTALQALALWDLGLRRWNEKRKGKNTPGKRPGVTINRKDVIAVPAPIATLLWKDLHVRDTQGSGKEKNTKNVRIELVVEGVTNSKMWTCGFEFDYANTESFYCKPLLLGNEENPQRMPVPEETNSIRVAFLPPMSGLYANETVLDTGAINVRIGEGRTAEVLRNLCYRIANSEAGASGWKRVVKEIERLFGVKLQVPIYIAERGEITLSYKSPANTILDISAAGRGLQQTLLLLAYIEQNQDSVILLDEPDAHLEILRQRQIYQVLSDAAKNRNLQIVAASHSEVLLNEAAERDVVVAFVGKPHRIDDRGQHVYKSLREIGFDQYYQAETTGAVLYFEGSTDLAILRSFAETLDHPARKYLERPFVHYVANQPPSARAHFRGLCEAKSDLVGFLLCDRLERELQPSLGLNEYMWKKREIENYLCQQRTLMNFAVSHEGEPKTSLFAETLTERRRKAMEDSISENVTPAALKNPAHPWWTNVKASDDFLDRVFEEFARKMNLPVSFFKKRDYHELAKYVSKSDIDPEITVVLDLIVKTCDQAKPTR